MAPRILVVEDDPVSREVVAPLLATRGFEIETAEDGFTALRMAQERAYDLVLIDYHLPEMDGYALARLMRSLGETTNPGMKMIAITADQFGLAARRGVDTVFDRVLSKPIDPLVFPALVDEILRPHAALEVLESFLGPDPASAEETSSPSLGLWRARGLHRAPSALVHPTPTPREQANIEHCFRIVDDAAAADCLMLLHADGLPAIEALRRAGPHYLLPLVAVEEASASIADVLFEPGNGDSWTAVAEAISSFASRRRMLDETLVASSAPEMRLLAFMFVSNRRLELRRSPEGHVSVRQSSGFVPADIAQNAKSLINKGLVSATVHKGDDKQANLITIEAKMSGSGRVMAG